MFQVTRISSLNFLLSAKPFNLLMKRKKKV